MKLISILLLIPFYALGFIQTDGQHIKPISKKDYPLKQFVRDYAKSLQKSIVLDSRLLSKKDTFNLELNNKVSKNDFEKMFYTILHSRGYTAINEGPFLRIISSRNIRYQPTSIYTDGSYPKTNEYVMATYTMKYPLSKGVTRGMRPFMSRYGRIIDFADAHSIVIHDRGQNIQLLTKLISSLDNKSSYERLLERGVSSRKKNKSSRDDKEKIKLRILKLKKKKLERELDIKSHERI